MTDVSVKDVSQSGVSDTQSQSGAADTHSQSGVSDTQPRLAIQHKALYTFFTMTSMKCEQYMYNRQRFQYPSFSIADHCSLCNCTCYSFVTGSWAKSSNLCARALPTEAAGAVSNMIGAHTVFTYVITAAVADSAL